MVDVREAGSTLLGKQQLVKHMLSPHGSSPVDYCFSQRSCTIGSKIVHLGSFG